MFDANLCLILLVFIRTRFVRPPPFRFAQGWGTRATRTRLLLWDDAHFG